MFSGTATIGSENACPEPYYFFVCFRGAILSLTKRSKRSNKFLSLRKDIFILYCFLLGNVTDMNQEGPLLETIPPSLCKPEQVAHWEKGEKSHTYQVQATQRSDQSGRAEQA